MKRICLVTAILLCLASTAFAGPGVTRPGGSGGSPATETTAGISERCTDVETTAGTKTDCDVTAANLKAVTDGLAGGHDAVTLDATTHADDVFGLTDQLLTLDNQTANYVLSGPATGAAASPAFRALVSADIPNNAADTSGTATTATNAVHVATTATTTDQSYYPVFAPSSSNGNQDLGLHTGYFFNASTGLLTVPGLSISGSAGVSIAKQSGVAGQSCVYTASTTDTYGVCWEGSDRHMTANLLLKVPEADPGANQVMLFPAPTTGRSQAAWSTLGTMAAETATNYVPKSLYDAYTILHATSDNTPAALTVTEQAVVGRATGGAIAALAIDSDLGAVSAAHDTLPSAKAVKNRLQYKAWTFDPKAVCDGAVDRLFLMSAHGGQGVIITKWAISFEADPTTEVDLDLKRADAWIGVGNAAVMDALDTTNGAATETTAANINGGAAVAEGKVIYLEFGTAYTEANHQIIFEMWFYEVGN